MTLNWGTGIAVTYGIFAVSMIGVVFASRKHDPGLVQKNYYELDLNYQERMERKQHTAALAIQPQVAFDAARQVILLTLPDNGGKVIKGDLNVYQLSTYTHQFAQKVEQTANVIEVPAQKLASGRWRLELEWESDGQKYFYDEAVTINR